MEVDTPVGDTENAIHCVCFLGSSGGRERNLGNASELDSYYSRAQDGSYLEGN